MFLISCKIFSLVRSELWRNCRCSAAGQGNECFKGGRYDEAVECYTQAIAVDGNSAVLYANRAMALLKLHK